MSENVRGKAVSLSLQAAEAAGARESTRTNIRGVLERATEKGEKLSPTAPYGLMREVEDHLRSAGRKGKALTTVLRAVLDPFEKRAQAMTQAQIEAVCETARSRDGVIVWQCVAGAGKTFSRSRVVEIAREAGYE